jgi:hypothetical protein
MNFNQLLRDPNAYLESVGRHDKAGLTRAIQEDGQGTVIRACLWRECKYTV